jgi:hypothetical protein
METHYFRYQILRYIADLRRMEPENIGIIVQGVDAVSCRFNTHLGNRPGFDFDNYRRWRDFFDMEINGPPVPVFQPDRTSIDFLTYLQKRCSGNYSLTSPLDLVMEAGSLRKAEDHLFETLVLPPDREKDVKQPVQKFKHELMDRKILKNPAFRQGEIFKSGGLKEWVEYQYKRMSGPDTQVLIQPVQVFPDMRRTLGGMQLAETLAEAVRKSKVKADISVIVDDVPVPSSTDDDTKKFGYEKMQEGKKFLRSLDVNVVDSMPQSIKLADNIEKELQKIEGKSVEKLALK